MGLSFEEPPVCTTMVAAPKPEIVRGPIWQIENGVESQVWWLRCPGCGTVAMADEDQVMGRVRLRCECGYRETHDLLGSGG